MIKCVCGKEFENAELMRAHYNTHIHLYEYAGDYLGDAISTDGIDYDSALDATDLYITLPMERVENGKTVNYAGIYKLVGVSLDV